MNIEGMWWGPCGAPTSLLRGFYWGPGVAHVKLMRGPCGGGPHGSHKHISWWGHCGAHVISHMGLMSPGQCKTVVTDNFAEIDIIVFYITGEVL